MIAILQATYPTHVFKQVVQAYTSSEIPKRPDSVRELSSISYLDDAGAHVVFTYDVPDAQVAEFLSAQHKRSSFVAFRAPGFNATVHVGQSVVDSIQTAMPLHP